MLKLIPLDVNRLNNLKCGEIYYETPTTYNISCCVCGKKQPFDDFPKHFQTQHLTQADSDVWNLSNDSNLEQDKPPEIPLPIDEKVIKCESDDEKSLHLLFPMDESPIDLKDVQSNGRKTKKIVVESLSIDSCTAVDEFEKCSEPDDLSTVLNINENHSVDASDNISDFDDNEVAESLDESNTGVFTKETYPPKETYFPCSQCTSSYKTNRGLSNHMRNKHKNIDNPKRKSQKLKCKECDMFFPNEKLLNGHMFKHTGIICDICGKPFSQVGNMNLHKIRHTGVKEHKCSECERTFYTQMELKKHMVCHTRNMPVICEVCGRGCRDQSILNAHMRRHTGERPAKCEVCGKCFFSIYDLNVHSVTHSTLRPFKCDVCGSTFQTKKALRVHKKLHSKDRKHVCKICDKSFAQSGGLYSHMKTHDTAEGVKILIP